MLSPVRLREVSGHGVFEDWIGSGCQVNNRAGAAWRLRFFSRRPKWLAWLQILGGPIGSRSPTVAQYPGLYVSTFHVV